ncbi:MAG: hypothetical protein ACRC0L_00075, partial [Angustibacter sp.]
FAWLGSIALFLLFITAGAIAILWWQLGARRWWIFGGRARINQYREMYASACEKSQSDPNFALVKVHKVGSTDENGTKAVVRHIDNAKQEAFFWGHTPEKGQILLVRVQLSNNGHVNRALQLHIGYQKTGGAVFDALPPATWFYGRQKPRAPLRLARPAFRRPRPIGRTDVPADRLAQQELAHHDLRPPVSELHPNEGDDPGLHPYEQTR